MEEASTGAVLVDLIDASYTPRSHAHDRADGNARRLCETCRSTPHLARLAVRGAPRVVRSRRARGRAFELDRGGGQPTRGCGTDFTPIIPALKRIVEGTYPVDEARDQRVP